LSPPTKKVNGAINSAPLRQCYAWYLLTASLCGKGGCRREKSSVRSSNKDWRCWRGTCVCRQLSASNAVRTWGPRRRLSLSLPL
jgi:hypothetical protein